jgi:hydrogenase-4 component E
MQALLNPEFGNKMVTLMAAIVLVLQLAMTAQRWLVTNIRMFGVQSFLLAAIAATIAVFNHSPHLLAAAGLTLVVKAIVVPIMLERLIERIDIQHEIEPFLNAPISVVIGGGLTLIGYVVAASIYRPEEAPGSAGLGHNMLAVAISLFLIGFFTMINRRKALSQVLGLLSLENGVFLATISLTYGVPLMVEIGIFFDVLVGVMVLGILIFRIRETFESMDVSRLRRLRG